MKLKRKSECPECKSKLTEFGLHVDKGTVECLRCHAQFNPINVLRYSDIVFYSESLPVDKQEAFLIGLGFEKQSAHRTSKSLLYGFLILMMVGSIFVSVMLSLISNRIIFLSGIIGGLLLCFIIYDTYKREDEYKWQRREEKREKRVTP